MIFDNYGGPNYSSGVSRCRLSVLPVCLFCLFVLTLLLGTEVGSRVVIEYTIANMVRVSLCLFDSFILIF